MKAKRMVIVWLAAAVALVSCADGTVAPLGPKTSPKPLAAKGHSDLSPSEIAEFLAKPGISLKVARPQDSGMSFVVLPDSDSDPTIDLSEVENISSYSSLASGASVEISIDDFWAIGLGASAATGRKAWVTGDGTFSVSEDYGVPSPVRATCSGLMSCGWSKIATSVTCYVYYYQVGATNVAKSRYIFGSLETDEANDFKVCDYRDRRMGTTPTGGGNENCGWFYWEISYDGGQTWDPFGDPIWVCPHEFEEVRAGDPSAAHEGKKLDITLLGTGHLMGGRRTVAQRAIHGNELYVVVDTIDARPIDIENGVQAAALLADEKGQALTRVANKGESSRKTGRLDPDEPRGTAYLKSLLRGKIETVEGLGAVRTVKIRVSNPALTVGAR